MTFCSVGFAEVKFCVVEVVPEVLEISSSGLEMSSLDLRVDRGVKISVAELVGGAKDESV